MDLPEPDRPVSHTVQPRWPLIDSRSARLTVVWCQTMFCDFGSDMVSSWSEMI